jgi:LacI family transcriptional regulator
VRITLKDIAEEAGVSLMTVSNVVNGNRAKVSAATIARVQEIILRRGYVPSAPARSLTARSSRLIGLLVPSADDHSLLLSPHNIAVFGVLERKLRDRGYHLLFRGISNPAEVDLALKSWNLDGAVLLGFLDEDVDRFVPPAGTPILALDSYSANPKTTGVRSDDVEGGRLAAAHLLEHGHRRIVFAGPAFSDIGVVRRRFEGFRQAHREAGVEWHPGDRATVVETGYERGIELGRTLREQHPEVTAVFATADIVAVGLIEGLSRTGVLVPEQISVVGFDNIDIGFYVTPKLTTVAQDVVAKASAAIRILLAEIEDDAVPGEPVVVGVELVPRDSVATRPAPP